MNFEKFEIPKIETTKGTEEGSTFIVIAKNKGVKMSVRFFLTPYPIKDSAWVTLAFRLRVEASDFNVTKEMAEEQFGNFPFYESKGHASAVGVVPLVALPCSPAEVHKQYTSFNGELETNIIAQIKETFGNSGAALCIDEAILLETVREKIKDFIPEVATTVNDIPKALWISADTKKKP